MSFGLSAAAVLQTLFVSVFLFVLMPFRPPEQKKLLLAGGITLVFCIAAGVLAAHYGLVFLGQYGYLCIGLPLFILFYLFSKAKGSRFIFAVMTILLFHRIISILLMVVRVHAGGYTGFYFFMNFLLFGALLGGTLYIRKDFHKIVLAYQKEFGCLSVILLLLLVFVWMFSPVSDYELVDSDVLLVAVMLYILILLIYLFIGVSFHSFSKRLDAERNALSLGHQMQAAQDHIALTQVTQEKTKQYRHDLRHHLLLIGEFLNNGQIEQLQQYLEQVRKDLDTITPCTYCSNPAANLIFASFSTQAQKQGVRLEIEAQIPQSLSISNTELCTLLSNAMENAIAATARVEDGRQRLVRVSASMAEGKLLLLVENPYIHTVRIENGLPFSDENGHGYGTKSMEAIAAKHGGLSSFQAQDGIFTVRIVT